LILYSFDGSPRFFLTGVDANPLGAIFKVFLFCCFDSLLFRQGEKPAWNPGDFLDDHYGKKAGNVRRIERLLSLSAYRGRLHN
jgi:hypothetical protein